MSANGWIKKMWYMPTIKYYSYLKKEGKIAIYDNIDESRGFTVSQISWSQK